MLSFLNQSTSINSCAYLNTSSYVLLCKVLHKYRVLYVVIVARKLVNNLVRDCSYSDFHEDYRKMTVELCRDLEETLLTRKYVSHS